MVLSYTNNSNPTYTTALKYYDLGNRLGYQTLSSTTTDASTQSKVIINDDYTISETILDANNDTQTYDLINSRYNLDIFPRLITDIENPSLRIMNRLKSLLTTIYLKDPDDVFVQMKDGSDIPDWITISDLWSSRGKITISGTLTSNEFETLQPGSTLNDCTNIIDITITPNDPIIKSDEHIIQDTSTHELYLTSLKISEDRVAIIAKNKLIILNEHGEVINTNQFHTSVENAQVFKSDASIIVAYRTMSKVTGLFNTTITMEIK